MRGLLFTLMLAASPAAFPATVYKWVDESGVTHYSDQPHPGAERIELQSLRSAFPAPPRPPAASTASARAPAATQEPAYSVCEVVRPANDEALLNVYELRVRVRTEPQLRPGHRLVLALDGRRVTDASASDTGEFVISPIFRGTHTLTFVVENERGEQQCQAPTVTFHVRQPSVQAPNPANRPRF
jgi:hypothetical protein